MKAVAALLSDEDLKTAVEEIQEFRETGIFIAPIVNRVITTWHIHSGIPFKNTREFVSGAEKIILLEAAQRWIASLDKWQTIETAPKDITILGYVPDNGDYPHIGIQAMKQEYGEWGDSVYSEWNAQPTHWQPLPEPPKQK